MPLSSWLLFLASLLFIGHQVSDFETPLFVACGVNSWVTFLAFHSMTCFSVQVQSFRFAIYRHVCLQVSEVFFFSWMKSERERHIILLQIFWPFKKTLFLHVLLSHDSTFFYCFILNSLKILHDPPLYQSASYLISIPTLKSKMPPSIQLKTTF